MIEQVAENICDNVEEKEIVRFGLERLKVAVVAMVLIIITGVLLHETSRSILLVICLLPLRQNAGGYHMRSSRICAIFSYLVLLLLILCVKFVAFDSWIYVLIWSICFALILLLSPVGTENHQLDTEEKKVYGKRARIICYIESALFLMLVYFGKPYWYKIILTAEIVTAILLIVGKIQEDMIGRKQ